MLSAHVVSAGLQTGHESEHCIQRTQCGVKNPSSNIYFFKKGKSQEIEHVFLRKFSPFIEKFLNAYKIELTAMNQGKKIQSRII